jgi:hypothetical protein
MATRNNLYLFAWLCALAVPWGLQLLAAADDDILSYMGDYYGPFSLYMFFTMTYGFATVFVSYYLVGGLRRAGTLDMLRVSRITPWEVVLAVWLELQLVLVPPVLAFMAGFAVYSFIYDPARQLSGIGSAAVAGGALMMVLNQSALSALMCNALYRQEYMLALVAAVLVLPLNAGPVVLVYMLDLPVLVYLALLIGLVAVCLLLAWNNLRRMWPPVNTPLKGT